MSLHADEVAWSKVAIVAQALSQSPGLSHEGAVGMRLLASSARRAAGIGSPRPPLAPTGGPRLSLVGGAA